MADRYQNRRIPMLVGLVWLLVATLVLCFSENVAMLIIARIFQGTSAAMTWTVGLAMLIDSVPKEHVGRATGWTSTALTVGILLGPLVGGIVYDRAGNYPVYAMCYGLLALDIFLRLIIIEVKDAKKWTAQEHDAVAAAPDATETSTDTATEPDAINAESATTSAPIEKAPSTLERGSTSNSEKKESQGAFSLTGRNGILGLLKKPRLLSAMWGSFIQSAMQTSFDATLPLVVRDIFGWNSIGGGLIFLPVIIPTFLGPWIGHLSDKYGPRWFTAGGFLFCVPFYVCFRFVTENTINDKVLLCGLLVAIGLGMALVFAPLMAEISWAAEEGQEEGGEGGAVPYAQAYALYNISFSAGAVLGPLLAGMVRDSAGFGTVGWATSILCGFTALVMANWTGGTVLYGFGSWKKKGSSESELPESAAQNTTEAAPAAGQPL